MSSVAHLRDALSQYETLLRSVYGAAGADSHSQPALLALHRWLTISCGARGQALVIGGVLDMVDADEPGKALFFDATQDALAGKKERGKPARKPAQGDEEVTVDEQQDDHTPDFFVLQTLLRVLRCTLPEQDPLGCDDFHGSVDNATAARRVRATTPGSVACMHPSVWNNWCAWCAWYWCGLVPCGLTVVAGSRATKHAPNTPEFPLRVGSQRTL